MSNKGNNDYNIKQIIAYLIIGILIIVAAIFTNDYDLSDTNSTVSNGVQNTITYTLENIPEYTNSPYIEYNWN